MPAGPGCTSELRRMLGYTYRNEMVNVMARVSGALVKSISDN